MYHKTYVLITLFLTTTISFAQLTISGKVMNKEAEPLAFCNMLLLNPIDSSLIKGEIIENGTFNLTLEAREILIKIVALGYNDWFTTITTSQDFGSIILTKNELETIEISAEKLPFESTYGNTKINVNNGIFSSVSSTQDLLNKAPGVMVTNGIITVIGSGEALIYLEGKMISLSAFQSIPVSQIESIEIIKNPDASYDAEGKAIILIVLKELGLDGLQATITSHYTHGFYHLGFGDLNLQFKKNKLTISAGANLNFGATGSRRLDSYQVLEGTEPYTANGTYRENVYLPYVTNYLTGFRYQLSPKQVISAQFNGIYSYYDLEIENRITQQIADTDFEILTLDTAVSIYKTNVLSANYSLKLDTLGSSLFAGLTYNGFLVSYADTIQETERNGATTTLLNSRSSGENKNGIGSFQFDYIKKFKNENTIKAGAKYNTSLSNSTIFLSTIGADTLVNYRNNQFEYKEEIVAAYTNWNGHWKKGDYQLGLRAEHTTSKAFKSGEVSAYLDTTYFSVFPNLGFTTKFKKWSMSDQFTSKISRPKYNEITPYIYYLNTFASIYGNPHVKPSFVYNYEHKFRYKSASLGIGYNFTKRPRAFVTLQDSTTESLNMMQTVNLDRSTEMYFTLKKSTEIKTWYNFTMLNISYTNVESTVYSFGELNATPKLYAYTYNQISIKNWFNFEIIGEFTGAHSNSRQEIKAFGELDLGISKTFASGACFFQITVNDIFQTSKPNGLGTINGNIYSSITTQDTRFLRVMFTYTFGKLKEPNYEHLQLNETETERAQ